MSKEQRGKEKDLLLDKESVTIQRLFIFHPTSFVFLLPLPQKFPDRCLNFKKNQKTNFTPV